MKLKLCYIALFLNSFLFCSFFLQAQQPSPTDTADKKQIIILHTDRLNFKKENDSTQLQSLAGNVAVKQENTIFYCDSAIMNKRLNTLEAFGHVHINNADSVHIYSDYLRYMGKERKAYLRNNVKLTDGKGVLTTSALDYDVANKIGIYSQPGRLVSGGTVLTSKEGYYYGQTRDVYFKKKVLLVDTSYTIKTDTLLYNTYTNITTFIVPTEIISGQRTIYTSDGYYDLTHKRAYFSKRPIIQDSTSILIADEMANDDSTGYGEARGNVIYKDTVQKVSIYANNLKSNRHEDAFLATQNPVMVLQQEADSIFIAADTLYSAKLSLMDSSRQVPWILDSLPVIDSAAQADSSSDRYFEAYYHVRIFSDSMQAVGDSLFYSLKDSAFRLFRNPVIWTQNNQITGDTIYLYTENKKPKRMYVFENALTISSIDSTQFYNQMKGRTIDTYFLNGNIEHIRTKGNAESVYYALDNENKFIGVNKASSDIIDIYFQNKQPDKIVFRYNLAGTMYPMRQVNHDEMKVRGFKWLEAQRPKSKYELFGQ